MSHSESSEPRERQSAPVRRSLSNLAAFVFGIPAAIGFLALVRHGPWQDTFLTRYFEHEVEAVEVILFSCAMAALLAKVCGWWKEKAAGRGQLLPDWDGEPVPPDEAAQLLDEVRQAGRWRRNTYLGRRVAGILDFVHSRRSANELDDQMRYLADNDVMTMESSYALTRFITWAIPILGFLGTVLGITASIANIDPATLDQTLGKVTGGLALAFDATAVALALTMVTMFTTFLVERLEEGLLLSVDRYVDEQLAHRFERAGPDSGDVVGALRQNSQVLLKTTEKLVTRQVEVWSQALDVIQRQWAETGHQHQQAVAATLETALERTLEAHTRRLAEVEKRSASQIGALLERLGPMADLVNAINAQTATLTQLEVGTGQVLQLQDALQQNLASLAVAGTFDQAVNSLTAAIHLLTARTSVSPPASVSNRLGRPGAAA